MLVRLVKIDPAPEKIAINLTGSLNFIALLG